MTPPERFQRNLGVFSSKERVPPLVLESAADGGAGGEAGDEQAREKVCAALLCCAVLD